MSDRTTLPMGAWDDVRLGAALSALAEDLAWPVAPAAGADPAARARAALKDPTRSRGGAARWRAPWRGRRTPRWALVLALVALLALAAVAGAAVLGLPGLRFSLGDPGPSATTGAGGPGASPGVPSASPAIAPGADLGLGTAMTLAEAEALVARSVALPADPALGPPDAVYVDTSKADAVALVWAPSPALPATQDPGVGLILMSFDGRLGHEYFEKLLGAGTTLERVPVGPDAGYWISGDPHLFFFEDGTGSFVEDERRWVGDALAWSDGTTTWRLESALGRDASLEIAQALD